jgi:hypothetical protein
MRHSVACAVYLENKNEHYIYFDTGCYYPGCIIVSLQRM